MFQAFPKIPRLKRDCIITEKIDGTNAHLHIFTDEDLEQEEAARQFDTVSAIPIIARVGALNIAAASRSRYLETGVKRSDNFGFAAWVKDHAEDLATLGLGRHYGEWWGQGIQRGYGLTEKRFTLFNPDRYKDLWPTVPVLYQGPFSTGIVDSLVYDLQQQGSVAAPGFMKPEGVVVYLTSSRSLYKVTVEGDAAPKGVIHGE